MALLHVLLRAPLLVVGDVLGLLDLGQGFRTGVANRDPSLFGELVDHLHQFLAPLFGERRQGHTDDGAVVGRIEADVRGLDRLLDDPHERAVPRLHDQQPRLRRAHGGDLVQRHVLPVGVDLDRVQQVGGGLPRSDAR